MNPYAKLLLERYPTVKAQFPADGRRKCRLRVLQEFWATPHDRPDNSSKVLKSDEFIDDEDPLDFILEGEELGILIRTDYSNEEAWKTALNKFLEAEKELVDSMKDQETADADVEMLEDSSQGQDDDSDASSDATPSSVIKVLDAESLQEKERYTNLSNLAAIRLFNDVDVRPAPPRAAGIKPISPPNRLIDQGNWQEYYFGKSIWIYDGQSNMDECVRVVNPAGDFYGTATGDSWRGRISHICELQFNMTIGMKIDFGGLDRWDYSERKRNLIEADVPIA